MDLEELNDSLAEIWQLLVSVRRQRRQYATEGNILRKAIYSATLAVYYEAIKFLLKI